MYDTSLYYTTTVVVSRVLLRIFFGSQVVQKVRLDIMSKNASISMQLNR